MANSSRAQKLLEASMGGTCNLFKEMKRVRCVDNEVTELPEAIGNAYGEAEVSKEFMSIYSSLYNSNDTKTELEPLKHQLSVEIFNNYSDEANKITGQIVKMAACRLKPNKSDVSGSFSSDMILNAPDIFFDILARIYRSWIIHGTVTLSLLSCAFIPLFKGRLKDPANPDSYRAIASSSLLLKLFDNVIILLWGHYLQTDSLQFGFKPGTSTTECSWLVMEVVNHFLRGNTNCIVTLLDCSKAFDMCKFSDLFKKLYDKKLPAMVLRNLIFVHEKQFAWVKWGNTVSDQFGIVNGTRQSSVLSPYFFAVYIDELFDELRRLGVGCHIGGKFLGAVGYADDILLLAPCRSAMAQMVNVCEKFGTKANLKFSTDINPNKSKSKCIYMVGPHVRHPVHPAPIQLYGKDLPWVSHANHLGHEIQEDATMIKDANMKRAAFLSSCNDIRSLFSFAMPSQVLNAVDIYSAHFYGSMLWDLYSEEVGKIYRSWNTLVKLIWGLPRSTHNYFVENILSNGNIKSARCKILSQYVGFVKRLRNSVSCEVRLLCQVAAADVRSTLAKNCSQLEDEFQIDPWVESARTLKHKYVYYRTPEADKWRLSLLESLLRERYQLDVMGERLDIINGLIDSLCSS